MLRVILLLSLAVSIRGDGMPLLCEGTACEPSDFEVPQTIVDTTSRYINYVQVNGKWVVAGSAAVSGIGGSLLPPRDRLNARLSTNSDGSARGSPRPYVETVWESYTSSPTNYESCPEESNEIDENGWVYRLKDVPVTSTDGMKTGADIVDIAYAHADRDRCSGVAIECQPYMCGLHLFKNVEGDADRWQNLLSDIQELKKKGAIINLAFGGDEWGNLMFSQATTYTADAVVDDIIKMAMELHADGINLVQETGVGTITIGEDSEMSVQLYMLDSLRARMPPQMMLTYTFPGNEVIHPFRDILKYGHMYVDYINVHMANSNSMALLMEIGLPQPKLSWGIPVGCNDPEIGDWGLEDSISVAKIARDHGFGGVMEWSVDRDTNRRTPGLGCCALQTGMPDGTYLSNLASVVLDDQMPTDAVYWQGHTYTGIAMCTL